MSNSIAFFKMPAIAAYQLAVKQGDSALEKMAARKDVKAEVDYFRNNIQSVKSVDDLFKDRRMMQVHPGCDGSGQGNRQDGPAQKGPDCKRPQIPIR